MTDTSIEWTDKTWNPVRGCTRVSEGCRNCYAEHMAGRFSGKGQAFEGFAKGGAHDYHGQSGRARTNGTWRWTGRVELIPSKLAEPLHWRTPRRIFVNSMSDLFHEALGFGAIAAVYGVMAAAKHHTFQVLTKRPERRQAFLKWIGSNPMGRLIWALAEQPVNYPKAIQLSPYQQWPLPNVWEGVSIEDQATADKRIPLLAETPAAKRFISYEPALGPVDFSDGPSDPMSTMGKWSMLDQIDWLIYGGESGPHARHNDLAWARAARDACRATPGPTAFFMKQLGAVPVGRGVVHPRRGRYVVIDGRWKKSAKGGNMDEWPVDLRVREFPT